MQTGRSLVFAAFRVPVLALSLLALVSCAEGGDGGEGLDGDDASIPWSSDAGNQYAGYEGGQSLPGPASTQPEGGSAGFLDGIFGGGGADGGAGAVNPNADAGENAEGWTLNADSAKECPAVPPPIPIVGGICVGVYFSCGWTSAAGKKYSCTCDWIHWLCI
jgi:hypothetical protein